MTGLQKHLIPDHLNFWNESKLSVKEISDKLFCSCWLRSYFSFAKIRPKFEKKLCSYPMSYKNTINIRTRLRKSNDGLSAAVVIRPELSIDFCCGLVRTLNQSKIKII